MDTRTLTDEDRLMTALRRGMPYRTVDSLADELGWPPGKTRRMLMSHPDVRRSLATDRRRRELFTVRERPVDWRERWATIRSVMAGP